jgi:hypothetical protein
VSYPVGRSYIEMRILLGMSVLMLGLHAWMFPLWGHAAGLSFPRWLLSLLFGVVEKRRVVQALPGFNRSPADPP